MPYFSPVAVTPEPYFRVSLASRCSSMALPCVEVKDSMPSVLDWRVISFACRLRSSPEVVDFSWALPLKSMV